MEKKYAKKIATYAMAATMIGGAVIGSGSTGVFAAEKYPSSATAKSAYSKVMSNTGTNYKKSYEDYKKAYEDFMNQYMQAPTVEQAVFDHGYIFTNNLLSISFTEVKYAKSYDVMISKDDNFKVTKTYTTEKPSLGVYTKNDDFLTPTWHGRYVKVRANYGYGIHGKWSEKKMIGCGKLHLHQDFVHGPFDN